MGMNEVSTNEESKTVSSIVFNASWYSNQELNAVSASMGFDQPFTLETSL